MPWSTPKTNWDSVGPVTNADMNRIEGNAQYLKDTLDGDYTINPAEPTPSNVGTIPKLFGWLAGRIKAITGKTNWYDAPSSSLETLHTNHISKTLFTAADDFVVASAANTAVKKTKAEVKTILGINQATATSTGVVELATYAELETGTDTTRVVTAAGLNTELNRLFENLDVQPTVTDASGKHTTVDYKRQNGTLSVRAVASNKDSSGNYTTITVTEYASNGTTVLKTTVWTIGYLNGVITTKEVL